MTRLPPWIHDRIQVTDVGDLRNRIEAGPPSGSCWVPLGGGRHLGRGAPPRLPGVALDLGKMNRVLEHAVDDLTITVEAGCDLNTLATTLDKAGQWIPGMPRGPMTVGGWIAADLRSCLVGGLGSVRDVLLRVVLLDGRHRRVEAGAKVVKSVAGYDLMKLVTGSLGSLGVVVEATFRVLPRPRARGAVRGPRPSSPAGQRACMDHLIRMWQPEAVIAHGDETPTWTVVVAGPAARVEAATRDIVGVIEGGEPLDSRATHNAITTFDHGIAGGGEWLGWGGALPGDLASFDLPPATGERFVADLLRGHLWLRFPQRPEAERVAVIRSALAGVGGVLHLDAPGSNVPPDPWGTCREGEATLFAGIRQRFDPDGVWPAGRLPGDGA